MILNIKIKFCFNLKYILINYFNEIIYNMGIGDWGLGIGDWGLGPIPNPQSPIPNPHLTSFYRKQNL